MNPRARDLVRDALAILAAHGLTPTVDASGRHIKIYWVTHGHRHLLVIPQSPSDYRARLNSRAVLRRLLRN